MKKYVFNSNLPEKIDLSVLKEQSAQLNTEIKVNYIGELNWAGGKKNGLKEPARVIFTAPDVVSEESLLNLLSNHKPLEHKPDPIYEKAMEALKLEKDEYLSEVYAKIEILEKRIEDLENN